MMDGPGEDAVLAQVRELNAQVTAFAGLGEALREVDGVLGQVTEGLAHRGAGVPLRTRWTGRHEVRAVVLA